MLSRLTTEIQRMVEAVHEESRVPGEHDREPSEAVDKEVWLEQNEESLHAAVLAALDRIEKGTFGRCEDCGVDIPAERLDVVPYARSCVACERKHEREPRTALSK
jgi:RNA polymerase-binding transcription factor DksA